MREVRRCIDAGHWPGPGEGDLDALGIGIEKRARIDARLKAEGLA
jgi:hypothetical protein